VLRSFDALLPAPAVLVHLRADPDLLLERVRSRGRGYETGITLDYLQALQEAYDQWIVAVRRRVGRRVARRVIR
jgi:deoxyadenosine/deoxycytidine kinase